jgi:uncharacterized protein YdhG (YjbR/CyaY superfamily)
MKSMKAVKNVDDYIANAPKEVQGKLKVLRAAIKAVAPKAEERISYSMPYYHYKGRLVYFAYAKHHIGVYALFPDEDVLKNELKGYATSKGTIRFPLKDDLPLDLIKKLVKARVKKIEEAESADKTK